jgi:hypothetical protein
MPNIDGSAPRPVRVPRQVRSVTHDVLVGEEHEQGTLTVSSLPDVGIVAVDLRVGSHGTALAALAEATSAAVSLGLRHGAPPAAFTSKADRIDLPIVLAAGIS